MRTVDLILRKRHGGRLSPEEIRGLVDGFVRDEVPDYQMAAFLMAVCFRGLDPAETAELTLSMMSSGDTIDLEGIEGPTVDKHSTGGVGDKTTLVLAPLMASVGLKVAKMSGRGLGHTGGTLDKLESLSGFRSDLDRDAFVEQVNRRGVAVISQTADLVPADRKMYALRDVTGTVEEVSLIAASIMSKKLAVTNDALVLDVKVGSGAFMKTPDDARALARSMVEIGRSMGRRLSALITEMSQPLGIAVGNALEVREAIDCLQGRGPGDLRELVLALGIELLGLTGRAAGNREARAILSGKLDGGEAWARFQDFVTGQGAEVGAWDRLPAAPRREVVTWTGPAGTVQAIDSERVGRAAMLLGAGRATKSSVIDPAVGVMFPTKIGQRLETGQPVAEIHARDSDPPEGLEQVRKMLEGALTVEDRPAGVPPVVHEVVRQAADR